MNTTEKEQVTLTKNISGRTHLLKYVEKNIATHLSYGTKSGNFIIDDITLQQLCESDYYLKNFCFIEKKTNFYKLNFDFDFHATHVNILNYIDQATDIVIHVIFCINKCLKKIFVKPNISYVYCDKNIDEGVHLYYPNIIVNQSVHQYVYNCVIIELIKNNKFNLSNEDWKHIFDGCITKANGLRFPYFMKDNTYYQLNESLSTVDIPVTRYEKVKLCCIRSHETEIYPTLKVKITDPEPKINVNAKISKEQKVEIRKFTEPKEIKNIANISIKELDCLLSCFKPEMFMDYKDWCTMGWYIFNCNNSEEACQLYHKYSQVGDYKNVPYNDVKAQFNKFKIEGYFNPNTLRYQARKENYKLFDTFDIKIEYDKREFQTIQFTVDKLLDFEHKNQSFIEYEIHKFIESLIRFFILKSPYGTGKTTLIKFICEKYGIKRILFITHRRSLAVDCMKSFSELGFCNYLDKSNFSTKKDRLIINIDSLHLLKEPYNFFTDKSNLKEFDLIILDECESLLNHFESDLMKKKDYIYSIFHDLVDNAKKVICFDGDISNRSYNYFRRFDHNIKIYENMFIPRQYQFIFGYDEYIYIETLKKDLEKGLNCVVISMSAGFCDKINKLFKDTYETLIIVAKTDDEIKKQMADSYELLKTKQLFIYSPSITVGVDISFKHFDRLYGYICYHSITARDFLQMLNRVRNPASSEINILIDGQINRSKIANYYEFEEIKLIYAHENNYNPNDITTYQMLRLWNKFEEINNKSYLFPILLHLIKQKGHVYEIKDEKSKKIFNKLLMEDIINAININEDEFIYLLEKQRDGIITQQDRLSIEKYMYAKVFKIDINLINANFMRTHYGKLDIVKNNKRFMNYLENIKTEIYDENEYDNKIKEQKMTYIKKLINSMGFNKLNDCVPKDNFEKNVTEMIKVVDEGFRTMFNMKKEEVDKISKKYDTNKKVLGFINSLINEWGIEVIAINKRKYDNILKKQLGNVEGYKMKQLKIIIL